MNKVYTHIDEYFENPQMTKIKNVENYSVYAVKIHCLLNNVRKYVMVFVDIDIFPNGHMKRLIDLKWHKLQTRMLEDNHNIKIHTYTPRRYEPLMVDIFQTNVDENGYTYYKCKNNVYPLEVILLPAKKTDGIYQQNGSLVVAIETYNTIVSVI